LWAGTSAGCRRSEAADATWREFDLAEGSWLLPAARVKNAGEHVLPLPKAVPDLLAARDFVFRGTAGQRPISGLSRRKAELDARIAELNAGVPIAPFTWHDLHRSAASGMAALGIAPHVVESVCALLDRGWGRAPQAHTAEDGENNIRITLRHITEGGTNGACGRISTAIPQKLPSPPPVK
jgi:integrase